MKFNATKIFFRLLLLDCCCWYLDIYRTGKWPEDFLQTILIPFKEKANAVRCEEYRTISLLTSGVNLYITLRRTDIGKFSDFFVMGTEGT